ncbi:heavy metal translocating P-type ATPase metal-binding domain-containing protein [bacterium]|nr:heavy metal translocating P-type ATPase metal-binding domain-containing protein [bacterium]
MNDRCPICGGKIGDSSVVVEYDGKAKYFCCTGCADIYQFEYENDLLDDEDE